MVQAALRPMDDALSRCLETDPSKPKSARLSILVGGDGFAELVFVLPSSLQPCVEGSVLAAQFPATRSGRQSITHVIYAHPSVAAPSKTKAATQARKPKPH